MRIRLGLIFLLVHLKRNEKDTSEEMMADKVRINPALIAALEHYAEGRYNPMQPSIYVYTDERGFQHPWPIERTCGVAAEVLNNEKLNLLKFKTLKAGLKKAGKEQLYEHIMGEKLHV
jgi:hypothetical protein